MSTFDEEDQDAMESVASTLCKLVPSVFPDKITVNGKDFARICKPEHQIQVSMISRLIKVIDECMGDLYVKHKGVDWRQEKIEELTEPGLVMLWYADGINICGFLSFKLVMESYGKALYLYEIQILPQYQGKGVGARLMEQFHQLASLVNSQTSNTELELHSLLSTEATSLTVFSDNEKAFAWYKRNGYVECSDSPVDRVLRNGTVIKPPYYLLTRPLAPA